MDNKETLKLTFVGIVAAVIAIVITSAVFLYLLNNNPQVFSSIKLPGANQGSQYVFSSQEKLIIDAVKKANPAVVAITISENVPVYEQYFQNPFGDLFGNGFFGGLQMPQFRQNGTQLQQVGGGSGFFISSDGYIVTNRHVVDDPNAQYTVFTSNGKKYDAKVIARDPSLDLAVIKINGSGFPYLTFADSSKLELGQSAIAIGNALAEFKNTVSVGVISGLSRSIIASDKTGTTENLNQLIQTDAPINPGNSGGPLLNLSGDVIGVNVAIAGGAQNIGFALSSNSVKSVVDSVIKTGKIIRPFLGIRYIPITPDLKKQNNLPVDYGVLVQPGTQPGELAVIPGSPADKAGIVENDIILEIDGVKLTSGQDLASIIRSKKIGDSVKLKILDKGQEKTVTVTLAQMNS